MKHLIPLLLFAISASTQDTMDGQIVAGVITEQYANGKPK